MRAGKLVTSSRAAGIVTVAAVVKVVPSVEVWIR